MLPLRSGTAAAVFLAVLACTDAQYGASSASSGNCIQGLNYCQDTLTNPANGFNSAYIQQLQVMLSNQLGSGIALVRCGANGTIKFLDRCPASRCINNGTGNSDYCDGNANQNQCVQGLNYCQDHLKEPASGFLITYLQQIGAILSSTAGYGPALLSCGANGTISFLQRCIGLGCTNNTNLGISDVCNPTVYSCTPGLNYCQHTLTYPLGQPFSPGFKNYNASYDSQIIQLGAAAPGTPGPSLWTCNADGTISFNQRCPGTACNAVGDGVSTSDVCAPNPQNCVPGTMYCQDELASQGVNWNSSYIYQMEVLLTTNSNPGGGEGVFKCNSDGSISLVQRCQGSCATGGSCNVDTLQSLHASTWAFLTPLGIK